MCRSDDLSLPLTSQQVNKSYFLVIFPCHQGYCWCFVPATWIHRFQWQSFAIFSLSPFFCWIGQKRGWVGETERGREMERHASRSISPLVKCTPCMWGVGAKTQKLERSLRLMTWVFNQLCRHLASPNESCFKGYKGKPPDPRPWSLWKLPPPYNILKLPHVKGSCFLTGTQLIQSVCHQPRAAAISWEESKFCCCFLLMYFTLVLNPI